LLLLRTKKPSNVLLLLNQRKKSPSDIGDSEADPNYSSSDDSYSNTSDNKNSSFDDVNVFALNEPNNIDFTTKKDNRKPNSRKKIIFTNRMESKKKTKLLRKAGHIYRTFK